MNSSLEREHQVRSSTCAEALCDRHPLIARRAVGLHPHAGAVALDGSGMPVPLVDVWLVEVRLDRDPVRPGSEGQARTGKGDPEITLGLVRAVPVVHSDPLSGKAAGVAIERHVLRVNGGLVAQVAVEVDNRNDPGFALRNDEIVGSEGRLGLVGRVTPSCRDDVGGRAVVALVVEECEAPARLGIGPRRQPDCAQGCSEEGFALQ